MSGRREAVATAAASPVDSLFDRKAAAIEGIAQKLGGAVKHDFDKADTPADVRAVTRPVFKVHYTRPGNNRSARVYVYGPQTEANARKVAESRLPADCCILRVETLDLVTARLGLRYGLSLKDVLTPDDNRTLLGDLGRVKAPRPRA